ncbi:type II toxin-antitoxin system VapB family antitoxin [Acidisoma cellulosilytica]|uniref:Type II toxin-antitoxin system VapB family antitoxin n=1 Tax=Acidisoma cellulosilyticum TaxID=2802395 RepID=A0A963Z4I7_9PROT|nr:type II toxin-antitoxin system VapB family antitoxin [Acidisoma cellulosilyticum]MCB8882489.1 type II toxin-antitoxin system VapB family antitoxin [Acidisoma cellulosilyticum]
MRITIVINDRLLTEALEITGLKTKKAVVEYALRQLIEADTQRAAIEDMRGLGWGEG